MLSVIIPTLDSPIIGRVVAALRRQVVDVAEAEILVVGSDRLHAVVEDDVVRFIPNPQAVNGAQNRNLGMRAARGDFFLFLDHDCIPAPDWIQRHLQRHAQGEQVVGGAVTFGERHLLQLADNVSAFHDLLPFTAAGPRPYLATANLSVRRAVVEKAGEMPAHLNRAHDLEWTVHFRELGYRLYFDPQAIVVHDPPRHTPAAVWRHWVDDAHDTLSVRLQHRGLLGTPGLAAHRSAYLWAAPLIAAWATVRTFSVAQTRARYWRTLPLVYLTKLAWCWGAFRHFPNPARNRAT